MLAKDGLGKRLWKEVKGAAERKGARRDRHRSSQVQPERLREDVRPRNRQSSHDHRSVMHVHFFFGAVNRVFLDIFALQPHKPPRDTPPHRGAGYLQG